MIDERARKLGDALVKAGVLNPDQLKRATEKASKENAPTLIISLLELEYLTFKVFEKFVFSTMGIKSAIISGHDLNPTLLTRIGAAIVNSRLIFPISTREEKSRQFLALGMVDPTDENTILKIESLTGWKVIPILISLPDFKEAVSKNQNRVPNPPEISLRSETKASLGDEKDRKFREEILAILDLDPTEISLFLEPTYSRESLTLLLQKLRPKTLQRIYDDSTDKAKLEGLISLLIAKGMITKHDILVSSSVNVIFGGKNKT